MTLNSVMSADARYLCDRPAELLVERYVVSRDAINHSVLRGTVCAWLITLSEPRL